MRHIGFSMPSVSFSFRLKNRAYLSNFAAMRAASSVQLSTSMNSRGTSSAGAITTTSARALPMAGFFQVPFTVSATSHRERDLGGAGGDGADPLGGVDGGLRGGDRFGRFPG